MRSIPFLPAALLLAACSQATSPQEELARVELSADRSAYRAGDEVNLQLTNHSGFQITYNFACGPGLHEQVEGSWVMVASVRCAAVGYGLRPGTSVGYSTRLPDSLEPGTYRWEIGVGIDGFPDLTNERSADIASMPFLVR